VRKMSKSLDNYVGVDEPPEEIYGKLMRVPDSAMPTYHELLLDGPPDPSMPPRDAKRAMARALTARFHGEEAARAAQERFDTLHVRRELPEEVEEFAFAGDDGTVHVPALLAAAFGISRSEGRRLLAQSGVRLDGRSIGEEQLEMPAEELDGAVIQLGKRRFKRLRRR
jgi:tyrosyl-tRNA synthetase